MDDEQPISPRSLAGHELYHQHLVDSKCKSYPARCPELISVQTMILPTSVYC